MECKMELGYKLVEKLGKVLHIDLVVSLVN